LREEKEELSMQSRSRHIALISLFSAAAVVFYVVESFIPRPLPWMRFGFGNIVVLISLYLMGFRISFLIALMKSVIGALIVGNLFTPAFLFSIGGSTLSVLIMALVIALPRNPFSPFGISIIGAVAHNLAQLIIATLLFVGLYEVLFLFPVFMAISIVTGSITGFVTLFVLRPLSRMGIMNTFR
jgi:heptaprenyl diphosphate synthase